MSAYRRMIGRELPCTVSDLLGLVVWPASPGEHESLRRRVEEGSAGGETLYRLGLSHWTLGEWGLARECLRSAVDRMPGEARVRLALAGVCDQLGEHGAAAECVGAVLADGPSPDAAGQRYALSCAAGFCHERSGDWRRAEAWYVAALSCEPDDQFALHRLVAIHLAHDERAAAGRLRELLRHAPQDTTARACLGHLLLADGHAAEAAWEYEQALCLQPEGWELPGEVARQIQSMEQSGEAIGFLEQLVGAQPHFADLRLRLGDLYSHCGRDEAATEAYGAALALHPEYLDCHIAAAGHELRMRRVDAAEEHFRQALAINEQNVEVYAGLSAASRKAGKLRQAEEWLRSASKIGRNSAVLAARLQLLRIGGAAEAELNDEGLEAVAETYRQALADRPAEAEAGLRLGAVYRLMGRGEAAVEALGRVVLADPACRDAWLELALLFADAGRTRQAEVALDNALTPDRAQFEPHYRLGLIHCGELEFDLAVEAAEAADAGAPARVAAAVERMQMTGLRRAAGAKCRAGAWVG